MIGKTTYRRYQQHVRAGLQGRGVWLPGDALELGDVGWIDEGRLRKDTDLQQLGISFRPTPSPQRRALLSCSSIAEMTVQGGANADAPNLGGALDVQFSREGSVVFEASGVRQVRIENFESVAQAVIELRRARKWRRHWVVVDQIWTAERASIVVATTADARVTFSAEGTAPRGLPDLVRAGADFQMNRHVGQVLVAPAESLTVGFTCRKLRWYGRMTDAHTAESDSKSRETLAFELDDGDDGAWDGDGKRNAILAILEVRGFLPLPDDVLRTLDACSDPDRLERWREQVETSNALADVFDG